MPGELAFIGLGLWSERDITLAGLDTVQAADDVFVEWYTAHLGGADENALAKLYGKPVRVLTRTQVEDGSVLLDAAASGRRVAFLVTGDAMSATTHTELAVRARAAGVATRVVHNASITSAVAGLTGLANYKFGRQTTLVFPEGDYLPTSPFDVVAENRARGLHTLCLLDLRAGGSEHENRPGSDVAAARHMTASEGADVLLRMAAKAESDALDGTTQAVVVARAGSPGAVVAAGPLAALAQRDFGAPLHTLVVPGRLHFTEEDALAALAERVA